MPSARQMTSAKLAREFQHVVAGSKKDNKTPDNLQVGGRIHLAKVKITSKKHKPVYTSVPELSLLQVA